MLQQWTDQGKVRLDDATLTLVDEQRTVTLIPAVRFTRLIDDGDDPNRLIGKVKTRDQLVELGAEHYMDSVILGDVGYTVLEGFLGDLSPGPRPPTAAAVVPAPAPIAPPAAPVSPRAVGAPVPVVTAPAAPPRTFVAPAAVQVTAPPAPTTRSPAPLPAPPGSSTGAASAPGSPVVVPARPATEIDDDAAALSALFLSTVREK
jgi:hypothetical protein